MFMSPLESSSYNHSEITSLVCTVCKGTVVNYALIMFSKTIMEFRGLSLNQSVYHLVSVKVDFIN